MDLVNESILAPQLRSARKLESLNLTAGRKKTRSASVENILLTHEKRDKRSLPNQRPVEEFVNNRLANEHLPAMPTPIIR